MNKNDFAELVKYFNENVKYETDLVNAKENLSWKIKRLIFGHSNRLMQIFDETLAKLEKFISE